MAKKKKRQAIRYDVVLYHIETRVIEAISGRALSMRGKKILDATLERCGPQLAVEIVQSGRYKVGDALDG